MKRNEHLQTLSRQHHNGLMAVLLIEKGLKKNADKKLISDFIMYFFETDLHEHFMLEENYLLPVMNQYPELAEHADRIRNEHRILLELKDQVRKAPSDDLLNAFAALLEQHIRFEERIAFPEAEKYFTETELKKIGSFLEHYDDRNCMSYPVKFWE